MSIEKNTSQQPFHEFVNLNVKIDVETLEQVTSFLQLVNSCTLLTHTTLLILRKKSIPFATQSIIICQCIKLKKLRFHLTAFI